MQFLLLVYIDQTLLDQLPPGEFDRTLHACFSHAEDLRQQGTLISAQRLEAPASARTLRSRDGRRAVLDGPFAETKEVLAGFNLIEAPDLDAAVRIAQGFAWSRFGSIEVRPVRDPAADRRQVAAAVAPS
jgi:hypothetical protein